MKYLIIIGSAYRHESEISIPTNIDKLSEWKVISIDHLPVAQDKKEDYTIGNVNVIRKQLDVSREDSAEYKQFIEDLNEVKQGEVYIIDSISCGFISNFAVKLIKLLKGDFGCSIFFAHYISSFNYDPSFCLTHMMPAIDADDSVIDEIMDIIDFKKPTKKDLLKRFLSAQRAQNYFADSLENFINANKRNMAFKENKSPSDLRSIISKFETRLIEFVSIVDADAISVESLDQYRKSVCFARNIYSVGGLELIFKNYTRILLYISVVLLIIVLLFVFSYLYGIFTDADSQTTVSGN